LYNGDSGGWLDGGNRTWIGDSSIAQTQKEHYVKSQRRRRTSDNFPKFKTVKKILDIFDAAKKKEENEGAEPWDCCNSNADCQ